MKAGRELDALVAEKVMGGYVANPDAMADTGDVWYWLHPKDGVLCGMPYKVGTMKRWDHQWHRWKPSTDIAAAWQVVDRLLEMHGEDGHFRKECFIMNVAEDGRGDLVRWASPHAAHIICTAALRAFGVEV